MPSKSALLKQQATWAKSVGFSPDARGYLASVDENLYMPLSVQALDAFEKGSGSELVDTPSRPAKMKALHSSSALAVNFFDYWTERDGAPLLQALGFNDDSVKSITFEAQYSTGLSGNPPNLDIAIELASGITLAIESKYSEWLTAKPRKQQPFKSKYFPAPEELWRQRGLADCETLAHAMQQGQVEYKYLDAPQLLKHALGLAAHLKEKFVLIYLYYDWPGPESECHQNEITDFSDRVGEGLRFRAMTYHELFSKLSGMPQIDAGYLDYLRNRYFR